MPGVRVGHGDNGPGCFTPTHEPAVTNGQLFGWEACTPLFYEDVSAWSTEVCLSISPASAKSIERKKLS